MAIIAHGEILASVKGGNTTVKLMARDLAVSQSTARRYADECVERGWLTRRTASEDRGRTTVRFNAYWLTVRGHEALSTNEEF